LFKVQFSNCVSLYCHFWSILCILVDFFIYKKTTCWQPFEHWCIYLWFSYIPASM